ncbi:MAG: ankyrin repeat domain-containing protein [Planctomycetota bacterium]|jgi:ankyrin repeat protein
MFALPAAFAASLLLGLQQDAPPVADAAMRGDRAEVRRLLESGADVNAAQGDGMSALHWAAKHGDREMAEMLIFAGANLRTTTRLGGYTPLLIASADGDQEMIELLINRGADPNAKSATGTSALHLAAASGKADAVRELIDRGAEVDSRENVAEQTPLMFAAARNRIEAMQVLLQADADPSSSTRVVSMAEVAKEASASRRQRSRRMAAEKPERPRNRRAQAPEGDAAKKETEAKAEEQKKTEEEGGQEPDTAEVIQRKEKAAALEAKQKAELAAEEKQAKAESPPDPTAELQGEDLDAGKSEKKGKQPSGEKQTEKAKVLPPDPTAELQGEDLDAAATKEDEAGSGEASEGEKAEKKPRPKRLSYTDLVGATGGMTALLHACRQGNQAAAELLLSQGADVNQCSGSDQTSPLLIATINGHFDLALYLLNQGADPNLASAAGTTPLYAAVGVEWAPHAFYPQPSTRQEQVTHTDLMGALLEAGADPNARLKMKRWYSGYNFDQSGVDETGATAFWRAAQSSDLPAMRLLIEHAADPNVWSKVTRERRLPNGANSDADIDAPPPAPMGSPANSPLHVATGAGFDGNFQRNSPVGWLPAVKYLIEELGFDVNEPDYKGYTPLHNAAFRGDNEMVLYLVEKGADVMAVAHSGQTTVDMANGPIQRLQPFPETIKILEDLGGINNHKAVSR